MYAFTLSESLTDYNEFYLEYKTIPFTLSADYAIDGLRVYRATAADRRKASGRLLFRPADCFYRL